MTVLIGDKQYDAKLVDGIADLNVSDLKSGEYVVLVTFKGDKQYNPSNATTTVVVSKVSDYAIRSNISDVKEGEVKIIQTSDDGIKSFCATFVLRFFQPVPVIYKVFNHR